MGGDAAAAEEPDNRQPGDPNPPEIKEKVNQDLLKDLMEMGFSELRGEKALYKTDNAGLEHAVNWLTEDAEAKAFELQTRLRQKRAEEEKLSEREKERMR